MFIVISYDIVDDRRRRQLSKYLLDYGTRVQKSVFECILSPRRYAQVKKGALKYIEPEEDSLRFYWVCENCLAKTEAYGVLCSLTEEEDVVIV